MVILNQTEVCKPILSKGLSLICLIVLSVVFIIFCFSLLKTKKQAKIGLIIYLILSACLFLLSTAPVVPTKEYVYECEVVDNSVFITTDENNLTINNGDIVIVEGKNSYHK